jgi:hypothetical protein
MVAGSVVVMRKHEETVDKLHKAMTSCKDKWFKKPGVLMIGWAKGVLMIGWAKEFLTVEGCNARVFSS